MEDALRSMSAAGTAAVAAVTFIHPIDVIKTRLQISGGVGVRNYKALGTTGTINVIFKQEGIPAFWKGIGAAWLREASYTSLRLGLYNPIKDVMNIKKESPFIMKFFAGSLAGGLGSLAGNPFDVLKTRMMATEGATGVSLGEMSKKVFREGIKGFYTGIQANILRAMVLNGTKMSVYEEVTTIVKNTGLIPKGIATQFVSAFSAGFFMTCTVAPFDMVRTRMMNNSKEYKGIIDCVRKIVRTNGFRGLYAGAFAIWARFAPNTVLQLLFFEQVKPFFNLAATTG
jgi:hypothetical protein